MMYRSLVIGLGQIGLTYELDPLRSRPSSHTGAYEKHRKFQLVAASDPCADKENILKRIAPNCTYYQSTTDMLLEQGADVVSICSPPHLHYKQLVELLEARAAKIIFCEKPVVSSVVEAEQLLHHYRTDTTVIIPNLSRRWNKGMRRVAETIHSHKYGSLLNIHIRYTRGIRNTGSHMFDLVNWFAGTIQKVLTIGETDTSSTQQGDRSYQFHFITRQHVKGYAEPFKDDNYYMFEIDLYFDIGKISIMESGNKTYYYKTAPHALFGGFGQLTLEHLEDNLLEESNMLSEAIDHIANILGEGCAPVCHLYDGLYPVVIAEAIERSFETNQWEYITPF